jgi:aryl-alcohol dehydrogenase-like predicted oxidoreductase
MADSERWFLTAFKVKWNFKFLVWVSQSHWLISLLLQAGYRHFDTGYIYGQCSSLVHGVNEHWRIDSRTDSNFLGTEPYLGAALRASGVPREEVFVTTKLPQVFLWFGFISRFH